MGAPSLLDRAKEIVRNRGVMTALAIAPLAMSVPVHADSVTFGLVGTAVSRGVSGGIGMASAALRDYCKTVSLSGYTGGRPGDSVTALDVAANGGIASFDWFGDLSGTVMDGATLMVSSDFTAFENHVVVPTFPNCDISMSWTLTATAFTENGSASYILKSPAAGSQDPFSNVGSIVLPAGAAKSWEVNLSLSWFVATTNGTNNPLDTLTVDIPQNTSIDLTVVQSAAPLPAPVWAAGSLLTMLGAMRIRKTARRK
jgi:hypothetical protein